MGNHVEVQLPSDWCYDKFRGYGTCVVFKRKIPRESIGILYKELYGSSLGGCYLRKRFEDMPIKIESYMVWLHYTWNTSEWKEAKNVVTFCFDEDSGVEVKEFGARLICDGDLEQDVTNSIITWWGHDCEWACCETKLGDVEDETIDLTTEEWDGAEDAAHVVLKEKLAALVKDVGKEAEVEVSDEKEF
ncbi:hypothetical protein Tco_1467167 [Tanacetum coccineum]